MDTELFYGTGGRFPASTLQVCKSCPVKRECLQASLALDDNEGIWGGMTPGDRRVKCGQRRYTGGPDWVQELRDHGTLTGYRRHAARGERPCHPCSRANTAHSMAYRDAA